MLESSKIEQHWQRLPKNYKKPYVTLMVYVCYCPVVVILILSNDKEFHRASSGERYEYCIESQNCQFKFIIQLPVCKKATTCIFAKTIFAEHRITASNNFSTKLFTAD